MQTDQLIVRYLEGDQEAFNDLAAAHQDLIYRLAYRTLGNHEDALDAVQEVLVRVMRSLPNFRGESKFTTWLYRLTVNTCIDYRRSLHRTAEPLPLDLDLAVEAPNQDPDTMCEHQFREFLIDQALQELPESQRLLVQLRDREGLSNQEVADILGLDVGTLKSRLHRARGALRRVLEQGVMVRGQERQGRFAIDPSGAVV